MPHDRHILYEAAVQGVEYDLDLFQRIYRHHRGRGFSRLREDFCGTALLASSWVRRRSANEAWAVDHDPRVLAWARVHRLPRMRPAAARLHLVRADVRTSATPRVDLVCAMNFSWWVFKRRRDLIAYYRAVWRSLRGGGVFLCNAFGGTGAEKPLIERTRIAASRSCEGDPVPPFTYVWEQTSFNPIDHHLTCSIHFRFRDGTEMRHAFRYDWRLWTLPEIEDALREAGFRSVHFYLEGWDPRREAPDEHYRLRRRFENHHGWLACVAGLK
jgi:SAM-dependent methyltransferase